MTRNLFCLLLFLTGGTLVAQDTATKKMTIPVSAPSLPTGSLLTGKTPANYSGPPPGWSTLCLQDFESALVVPCVGNGNIRDYADTQWTTAFAHTGTHSSRSDYGRQLTGQRHILTKLPSTSHEVYASWYERYDPQGRYWGNGGNFFEWEIHGTGYSNVLDWCCAATGWGTTTDVLSYLPQVYPTGGPTLYGNRGIGVLPIGFDGNWHQWEVHYLGSTQTCATKDSHGGCPDGVFQVWRDGTRLASFTNVDLNGTVDVSGMAEQIGGSAQWLVALRNATSNAQCTALYKNHGPYSCATSMSDGAYGCTFTTSMTWAGAVAETGCSIQFPTGHEFYKYVDDVILLYR